jgi:hypothetical protein
MRPLRVRTVSCDVYAEFRLSHGGLHGALSAFQFFADAGKGPQLQIAQKRSIQAKSACRAVAIVQLSRLRQAHPPSVAPPRLTKSP